MGMGGRAPCRCRRGRGGTRKHDRAAYLVPGVPEIVLVCVMVELLQETSLAKQLISGGTRPPCFVMGGADGRPLVQLKLLFLPCRVRVSNQGVAWCR
jgi:hypothetical protein